MDCLWSYSHISITHKLKEKDMRKNNTFGDYFFIFIMLAVLVLILVHLGDKDTEKLVNFQSLTWDYIFKPFKTI